MIDAAHPVSRQTHAVLETIGILVVQIAHRFRSVNLLQFSREDLGFLMVYQPGISTRDFEHDIRQLLDRVQINAADVVSLAGAKVVGDVCDRAHGVSEVS